MKISKEDIIRINKGFGGSIRDSSSLDFALKLQESRKLGDYKKLAYLWRAILVDHPFTDANKRTATFIAFSFAYQNGLRADRVLLVHHTQAIAIKNITSIRLIEARLKNAIR